MSTHSAVRHLFSLGRLTLIAAAGLFWAHARDLAQLKATIARTRIFLRVHHESENAIFGAAYLISDAKKHSAHT
jgi:hypothetical protein